MKLIDADALRDCLHIKEKCEDCHYFNNDCSTKPEYTLRDICGWIDEVDVIDAIPIDWFYQMIDSAGKQRMIGAVAALRWVLAEWADTKEQWLGEQEAR